jgi:hypothetical protein
VSRRISLAERQVSGTAPSDAAGLPFDVCNVGGTRDRQRCNWQERGWIRDITQDVDVLVWWRDVGQARFPRIAVMMTRQFLAMHDVTVTVPTVLAFGYENLKKTESRK